MNRWLLTCIDIVDRLELERSFETLTRPLRISDELDVKVWPGAQDFYFRGFVAEDSYCRRLRVGAVVNSDQVGFVQATGNLIIGGMNYQVFINLRGRVL